VARRGRLSSTDARIRASRFSRAEAPGDHDELRVLAREQSALRRVATLIAREASPSEVFALVAREVAGCLDLPMISVVRYESDGTATQVGAWGRQNPYPVGLTWAMTGTGVASLVADTGQPARVEDYAEVPGDIAATLAREAGIRSGVGVPIAVGGRLWGVMMAMAADATALPGDTEGRLASFTELVATAIANTQARDDLHRLVAEQSALRRVATLVAGGAPPKEVFDLVCRETGSLIGASTVNLAHFTPDGVNVTMAGWSTGGIHLAAGTRLPLDELSINALVQRTSAPGRVDTYEGMPGEIAERLRLNGVRSEVGAPVIVAGHVWGALIAGTDDVQPLPPVTERRVASFAELTGTAISNAADRAELVESRARIVAAGDEARRRLARDLHDGAQQRLVSVILNLRLAAQRREGDPPAAADLVDAALEQAQAGLAELRDLAAGVHPSILTDRGLRAAVGSLADRCHVPVAVTAPESRYPPTVEAAAYFIAAEALTNIDKHAEASRAELRVREVRNSLVIDVNDDGRGGAAFTGTGLIGIKDRVEALGGGLVMDSRPGRGTHLHATLPLPAVS
jgi:signal transduction histidine kinase